MKYYGKWISQTITGTRYSIITKDNDIEENNHFYNGSFYIDSEEDIVKELDHFYKFKTFYTEPYSIIFGRYKYDLVEGNVLYSEMEKFEKELIKIKL